jgi:3-deoxy-D-manno-octulosonic-acid transferase
LHVYSWIFVQDKESESLLNRFGISNVLVSGDTRFDRVLSISAQTVNHPEIEQFAGMSKLWVCGSTWEEDEQLIFPVFERLLKEGKKIKLLIAPHDVSEGRIKSIVTKFPDAVLYSKAEDTILPDKTIMIIDKIGLLSFLYRYGDIAYIGGGFGKGIHNVTEAAVYGIPVIFGSNYYKFNEATELIKRGAGFSVSNESELVQPVRKLLDDETYCKSCGVIAAQYIREGAGATSKVISVIEKELN